MVVNIGKTYKNEDIVEEKSEPILYTLTRDLEKVQCKINYIYSKGLIESESNGRLKYLEKLMAKIKEQIESYNNSIPWE